MNEANRDTAVAATKAGSAWVAVGMANHVDWQQVAGFVATVYTIILLGEWLWKKVGRDFCERRGWVKPKRGRRP